MFVVAPPSASGTLADKPLAHLLVYTLDKRLSGTLELASASSGERATVQLVRGKVAKIRTSAAVCYLGSLLYELGCIDSTELDASLMHLAKAKTLHGQVLVARGAIHRDQLANALYEQTLRKVTHLFTFAPDTAFAFHADADLLASYGSPDGPVVDPCPAIWRGIRDAQANSHVASLLARLGQHPIRLAGSSDIDRFRFLPDELAVAECLSIKAMTVAELRRLGALPASNVDLLVYCLFMARQIEVMPMPSSRALPAQAPSAPRPAPSAPSAPRASGTRPISASTANFVADLADRARFIRERARAIVAEDFFERLSVSRDASMGQIDKEFHALAGFWQPSALPVELSDVRDDCARVYFALGEAYETLSNPDKRDAYVKELLLHKIALYDPAADIAATGAKSDIEAVKICMTRNDLERAERLARHASRSRPRDAHALALVAWLEALQPVNQTADATLTRLAMLDRAVALDTACEDAIYYRAQLHSRLQNHRSAMRDLKRVVELNPDHMAAVRALRVYHMRIQKGSIQMAAVDPNTTPRNASGVVSRATPGPIAKVKS